MQVVPWVIYPSAELRRAQKCCVDWQEMGYKVLVFVDKGNEKPKADHVMEGDFPGYYRIINKLCDAAFALGASTVTAIGDDIQPDPVHSGPEIAMEYLKRWPTGLGVLQATGDRQGTDQMGVQAAARICGSPTFGREWHERAYRGLGAFCNGYISYYGDEELWNVSKRLDLLWLEERYTFTHAHWSFGWHPQTWYQKRNSDENWAHDKEMFVSRQLRGFPKSELK